MTLMFLFCCISDCTCPGLEVSEYLCFTVPNYNFEFDGLPEPKGGMEGADIARWELGATGTYHPHLYPDPHHCEDMACSAVVLLIASVCHT